MSRPGGRARQAGSAYLLALLVLTVLTGVGIVLSRVAQIERQLGSTVRARAQARSTAESGLAVAEARLVESERSDPIEFVFGEVATAGGLRVGNRTLVEQIVPVAFAPCNLCETDPRSPFRKVDYSVISIGERRAWRSSASPGSGRLLASSSVEATLTLQPWQLDESLFFPEAAAGESP